MDRTETYIKMCGKAEEIQELRREEKHHDTGKWLNGDFYGSVLDARVFVVSRGNDAWADEPYYIHHPSEAIWLPRQDQLQEMVKMPIANLLFCIQRHYQEEMRVPNLPTSMEQLWLAFVEKDKYNKQWSNGEWL